MPLGVGDSPKLLIVWNSSPHRGTGAELLMNRMFLSYPRESLYALTTTESAVASRERGGVVPPGNLFIAPEYRIHRRVLWHFSRLISWLMLPWIVSRGVQLIRRHGIEAMFAVPWNQFCAAAYLIHRRAGCPLYLYAMDDPFGARPTLKAPFYSYFMPRIVRAARRVWGVSDGMCEYIEKTYGAKCLRLLPTADLESFHSSSEERLARAASSQSPLRVVYTGSVYGAQLESLQRFLRTLSTLSAEQSTRLPIEFTLYTTATRRYLAKIGLDLPESVQCMEVRHDEIPRVLAEADAAFLPFSFDPGQRHVVETSLPSKIAEYLASGIPILAHAPAYSTVARYCRENDCALIVDQPDEAALREALRRLATDQALREKLSRNAREAARRNHDARVLVPRFLAELVEAQDHGAPK